MAALRVRACEQGTWLGEPAHSRQSCAHRKIADDVLLSRKAAEWFINVIPLLNKYSRPPKRKTPVPVCRQKQINDAAHPTSRMSVQDSHSPRSSLGLGPHLWPQAPTQPTNAQSPPSVQLSTGSPGPPPPSLGVASAALSPHPQSSPSVQLITGSPGPPLPSLVVASAACLRGRSVHSGQSWPSTPKSARSLFCSKPLVPLPTQNKPKSAASAHLRSLRAAGDPHTTQLCSWPQGS